MRLLPQSPSHDRPPFFVMGCEASGTTLVSLLLDAHSRTAVCRGTYYYRVFAGERRYYGDLRRRANLNRFVHDVRSIAVAHRVDSPPASAILRELREPTFPGVLATFLALYARARGKERAGERSAGHYAHAGEIADDFPASALLFTMRDPRDVAVAHATFGLDAASATASWNAAWTAYRGVSERAHVVRYEELVRAPRETLEAACAALGEAFEPGMLQFHEHTPQLYRGLAHHAPLFEPLTTRYVGRFEQLPERDLAHIESECAPGMADLGYEPVLRHAATLPPRQPRRSPRAPLRRRIAYLAGSAERRRIALRRWALAARIRARYIVRPGVRYR